jgi:glucose/arabinose dehydrogenase
MGAGVLAWIRGLPRPAVVAGSAVVLLALLGAAAFVAATRRPAPRVAVLPSPVPSASVSPTPTESPSPSPSASPSPSPSPSDSPTAAAPAPTAAQPAPVAGCAAPAGGFPGSRLAANYPVALAWSPDGRLFWAERSGTVRVYEGGAVRTFATVSTSTSGERGLLGLAISGNHVFAFYSDSNGSTQDIIRWTDCLGNATAATLIASGLPAGSDCCHKGGRLAIGPDGGLYATIGDNHVSTAAQVPGDLRGKVLRFNQDGSGRTVWTSGLRNPFGIAFSPDGTMALTNNRPSGDAGTPCGSCGDEFYVVGRGPGVDYQWPYCWGYSHPVQSGGSCHGLPGPQYSTEGGPYAKSSPYFVAPTGMTWYAGHFVFCAFSTQHLYVFNGQGSVGDTGMGGCELDVKQGPDGALYTSDTGAIYRH